MKSKIFSFKFLASTVAIAAIILWVVWAAQKSIFDRLGWKYNQADLGQWGDTFGGLNALFTALGLVAVMITIHLQQKQIQLTLADIHRQRFEAVFFDLLGLLREARGDVRFRFSPKFRKIHPKIAKFKTQHGQRAFQLAIFEMRFWLRQEKITKQNCDVLKIASIYRERIHSRYESIFSPYFRLVYTILRQISADPGLSAEEKARFGNIFRSQLTTSEIGLIGLNAQMEEANDFDRYIVEFRLLKYLPPSNYFRGIFELIYPSVTFDARD